MESKRQVHVTKGIDWHSAPEQDDYSGDLTIILIQARNGPEPATREFSQTKIVVSRQRKKERKKGEKQNFDRNYGASCPGLRNCILMRLNYLFTMKHIASFYITAKVSQGSETNFRNNAINSI